MFGSLFRTVTDIGYPLRENGNTHAAPEHQPDTVVAIKQNF